MRALRVTVAAVLMGTVGCGGEQNEQTSQETITITEVGFSTPESILHDRVADVYLVANINGSPFAEDDNGFISRVAPDGSVLALKWIDGANAQTTLNAPKGMGIRGDTLFVADITALRLFNRNTGEQIGSWGVPGSTFLNDVTVDATGTVYVSDSGLRAGPEGFEPAGTDAVYRFAADGAPQQVISGDTLGRPNGLVPADDGLVLVTFGSGAMMLVNTGTGSAVTLAKPPAGQLDGVVRTADGSLLISSWESQAVYRLDDAGVFSIVVEGVESPADIGYDASRNRVLIPLFSRDEVRLVPIPGG